MAKIALAIRIVAGVTLATGVLVLAGAIAAARQRHRYQAVILKVLGARRQEVLRLFLMEYPGAGSRGSGRRCRARHARRLGRAALGARPRLRTLAGGDPHDRGIGVGLGARGR